MFGRVRLNTLLLVWTLLVTELQITGGVRFVVENSENAEAAAGQLSVTTLALAVKLRRGLAAGAAGSPPSSSEINVRSSVCSVAFRLRNAACGEPSGAFTGLNTEARSAAEPSWR
jgi:hypothetical protein